MMATDLIRARVQSGVHLLDEIKPDWRDHIDVDDLDLSNPDRCVLGQNFRWYWRGVDIIRDLIVDGTIDPEFERDPEFEWDPGDYGFNIVDNHGSFVDPDASLVEDEWGRLQEAWMDELG